MLQTCTFTISESSLALMLIYPLASRLQILTRTGSSLYPEWTRTFRSRWLPTHCQLHLPVRRLHHHLGLQTMPSRHHQLSMATGRHLRQACQSILMVAHGLIYYHRHRVPAKGARGRKERTAASAPAGATAYPRCIEERRGGDPRDAVTGGNISLKSGRDSAVEVAVR